ncbi:putative membrane protein [Waddlia chondrophila 2032/99]|uniref:Putative membrane protein n=2 Tax=Waddlia chondrophila TaxID=71667 RepID=D6YW43_WADCW|nr:hypothetical protein [Waddlia chondrophila]ADI38354.1 putative membrane protein [Waddlia chondrophila WSU 86-1044]CCB91437.1 putative membrane protein [Waddlia chondrophila 2032/99]
MKKLFHFFGSIHFAISLIATTALFVIAGTLIESWADSHQYAASLTYEHPAFLVLLFFFFINILFAALRRWPFRPKHIPFLITHLGLLMIIAGVVVKTFYGLQGVMMLIEGSGSDQVRIPHTKALRMESREHQIVFFSLDDRKAPFQLVGYAPHSTETYNYWIKGNSATIQGLPPFPVFQWDGGEIPLSGRAKFTEDEVWNLVALRTDDVGKAAEALYQQRMDRGVADLDFHSEEGLINPTVKIDGVSIPLKGEQSLVNDQGIDLTLSPTLAFMQDVQEDTHLFFFDRFGRVFYQKYRGDQLPTLAVYDEGFSGYHAVADIPYYPQGRKEIQEQFLEKLCAELQNADPKALAPPFKLLFQQIGKDYDKVISNLFRNWSQTEKANMPSLDWSLTDQHLLRSLQWAARYLEEEGNVDDWPIAVPQGSGEEQKAALVQQLASIGDRLPPLSFNNDAALLKAYLLLYGIYPSAITPPSSVLGIEPKHIFLETPLTFRYRIKQAGKKIEENQPIASLKFEDGKSVTLSYDAAGTGLCRPACNGQYLVRFQPEEKKIPYHIRLRNAKAITYANSQQPFSYEAEIYINGKEKTLSMNQVHETWDGYRFYLSSISSSDVSHAKRVQLIVNRDPAKYWLTYPGGSLVSLGIFLLFWWRPMSR